MSAVYVRMYVRMYVRTTYVRYIYVCTYVCTYIGLYYAYMLTLIWPCLFCICRLHLTTTWVHGKVFRKLLTTICPWNNTFRPQHAFRRNIGDIEISALTSFQPCTTSGGRKNANKNETLKNSNFDRLFTPQKLGVQTPNFGQTCFRISPTIHVSMSDNILFRICSVSKNRFSFVCQPQRDLSV